MDTAAATPLDPRVKEEMERYLAANFANPASLHKEGGVAARALAEARARIAKCLGAHPDEIIFTSGGTEANNLAIFGAVELGHQVSKWDSVTWTPGVQVTGLVSTAIEHVSVLEPAKKLAQRGLAVTYLSVNREGVVDLKKLKTSLTAETPLVSIIYAHNEIGIIQPVKEIIKVIRHFRKNNTNPSSLIPSPFPLLHLDACQAPRFLDINVERLGVDLMTINAGKIYGPRGVGALYVRRGVKLEAQLLGGGQEAGRRAGTEDVAGAIGLATALELCEKNKKAENAKLGKLRDQLITGLLENKGVILNGPSTVVSEAGLTPNSHAERLPSNVNVSVAGLEGEQMVIELAALGIACSTGAACAIPDHNDSYVIMALGKSQSEAESAVRFTLDRDTTSADIKYVLKSFNEILKKYAPNTIIKI